MSVPAREVSASPRRISSSPTPRSRGATRRRGASVVLIGAFIAQLTMFAVPLAASASVVSQAKSARPAAYSDTFTAQLTVGLNNGFTGGTYAGLNGNATNPNPQDLTAAGTTDWKVWGLSSTSLAGDNHKSGGSGIGSLTSIDPAPDIALRALGPLSLSVGTGGSSVPFSFAWTGGDSTGTATGERAGLQHEAPFDGSVGFGFSFTVPATTTPQRLTLWVSAHHGTGRLTTSLGGVTRVDTGVSGGQNHGGVYTIDFAGDGTEAGTTLSVEYVLASRVEPPSAPDGEGFDSSDANVAIYAAALNPELVTNGSFEEPSTSSPDFDDIAAPSTAITGWSVSSGSVDHVRTHWAAAAGLQSIDLEGIGPGTIEQTLPTTPGADYRLTFQYAANPDGGPTQAAVRTADVLVNGLTVATVTHAQSPFAWQAESLLIHATGASTTLAFHSTASTTAFGIAIDAVSVVPIGPPPVTVDGPVLTAIYSTGGDTYYAGHMPAVPGASYGLSFASASTCPGSAMSPGAVAFATTTIMAPADGGNEIAFRGKVGGHVPGAGNPYVAARVSGPAGKHSDFSPCVVDGPDNDTWPRALPVPLLGPSTAQTATTTGFLDVPGRERWFKFTVQPGAHVQVALTGLPADYDLVLFKDIGSAYNELANPTSTTDLSKLGAEYSSSGFTSSGFTSSGFTSSGFTSSGFTDSVYSSSGFTSSGFTSSGFTSSGFTSSGFTSSGFTSSGFTDQVISSTGSTSSGFTSSGFTDAFSGAQTRSLVAISSTTGTGDEFVAANTWTNTGDYYIRMSGKNGASSLAAPFTLAITQNGGQCDGIAPTSVGGTTVATGGSYKTIILTDSSRLPAASPLDQSTLHDKLVAFAGRAEVGGVIVDLASDARIQALNVQADGHPSCVYAKNLVADGIRDIVQSYRALNSSSLQYVVIVGGDDVIPFFRYPDNSDLGPESAYIPPVSSESASEASLRFNYVLSQDAYGAGIQISLYASSFPIPDLAVGRLVETASEVSGMLDAYTATAGVVHPQSSLVTGYDFLADAAEAARTDLSAGTGAAADTLIAPFNVAPTDPLSWTADQLKAKLLGARHDLVFLAGHFSANSALAADFTTSVLTTDLTSSALDQSNVIVLSIGCHSGYNIVDGAAVPNITLPLDWAQALAQKKMTGILGTGYQYGDTDFIAYSERIYTGVAHRLRYGTGAIAIGKALVAAKLDYLKATPDIRGLHEKALREATLYGLPMLGVDLPSGRGLSDPSDATVGTLTGYPAVAGNPGYELGLQSALVSIDPTLEPHSVTLRNLDGSADLSATYYSGPAGVLTNPGEPAIPLDSVNVGQANYVLRGVGFWDGTYSDQTVVPLNGAPATELKTAHTPFVSSTFFPSRMWTPDYYDALSQGGGTRLLVTPAQHRAINPGDAEVTLRTYSHLGLKLFYSNNVSPGSGSEAPSISGVTAGVNGSDVTFSAHVVGDTRAGVQEVWVTYTGLTNAWTSVSLEQDPTDSSLWTTTIPLTSGSPKQVDFMVQAVNGFGLVTVSDNYGAYHKTIIGSTTPAFATSLALDPDPAIAVYGSAVPVTATLTGTGSTAGKPIVFTLGPATRTATTDASGVAIATMPVMSSPGPTILMASFGGDTTALPSATSRPFTIAKIDTTIAMTPAAGPVSTGANTGIVATLEDANVPPSPLAQRTVYFVVTGAGGSQTKTDITDYLGRASLGSVSLPGGSYTVTAYFNGTIPLLPGADTIVLSDGTYGSSSASTSLTIKPSQTITFTSAAPTAAVYGDSYTPTATGGGSGNPVTFSGGGACSFGSGKITMTSSGTCTVTANQAGNGTYDAAPPATQAFAVGRKGATLGYTGNLFWSAGSGSSASVTFSGQVTRASGGTTSITNATVDFLLFHSANHTATPDDHCLGSVNSSGVATCVKSLGLDNWTVVMTISAGNSYFTAPNADPVVLTVYQAGSGKYATGAGWIIDPSYHDIPVKVSLTRNHGVFGFAVSYKSGTTPQGVAVYGFRGVDGYDYVFTTTSWTGGGLSFGTGSASFSARCAVTVINPATLRTVSGLGGSNFTCRFDVRDGSPDKFAMSAYTSAGVLYHQAGTAASPINIGSGAIVVKNK